MCYYFMNLRGCLLVGREGVEVLPEDGRWVLSGLAQGPAVFRTHTHPPGPQNSFLQMREEWTVVIKC